MKRPELDTIGKVLYWSYANLAMAHAAVSEGAAAYERRHFAIRSRLYHGLVNGTMALGSILDEERLKLRHPHGCAYCGTPQNLSLDHLLPSVKGGPERADNIVYSCRSCNSSKGSTDFLEWWAKCGEFPPLLLLRRYLKLAVAWCEEHGIMDLSRDATSSAVEGMPFSLDQLPLDYPQPARLRLWVAPLPAC
ncbi:MAG: HNH endonuclease [Pirellulales bacterium]